MGSYKNEGFAMIYNMFLIIQGYIRVKYFSILGRGSNNLTNCMTNNMTERKCFSNVLTARVLKSRWTETTRSVEQSL